MTRSPVTIPAEAPIRKAAELLRQHRIRHLPVLSGGRLCGVLSDRDLKSATPPPGTGSPSIDLIQAYERPASAIMTSEAVTVAPGDSIADAARLMRRRKIGCLPVVYNDHLIGILTETDVLDALLSASEEP
ncbi:MAG: CBS domain-containing protein [Candidatus Methylomirabilales bacterium]